MTCAQACFFIIDLRSIFGAEHHARRTVRHIMREDKKRDNSANTPQTGVKDAPIALDDLAVFAAVAQAQSFAGAGVALGLDRSRVSRIIGRLEAGLGVALFTRTTRTVRATAEGHALLERCAPALDALRAALRGATQSVQAASGEVVITTTHEIGQWLLAPLIPALRVAHPGVTLRIVTTEQVVDLVSAEVDIALRTGDPGAQTMMTRKLCELGAAFYAAPAYLAARGEPRSASELASHERLWPAPPRGSTSFGAPGALPTISSSFAVTLGIARAGGGIAMLPRFIAAPDAASGALIEVLTSLPGPSAPLYLITRPERPQPARVRAVCDALVAALSASMS
jgi:DNA-binding transcriptional LysR family regulator